MKTRELARPVTAFPTLLEDVFKPFSNFFNVDRWGQTMTVPAVNIMEDQDAFHVSLAAPGLKKQDFKIDLEGNMLTISTEQEEREEEENERYTKREYSYSSFSRSFNLPEGVNKEEIAANYEDGILKVSLPKKEELKRESMSKTIEVR